MKLNLGASRGNRRGTNNVLTEDCFTELVGCSTRILSKVGGQDNSGGGKVVGRRYGNPISANRNLFDNLEIRASHFTSSAGCLDVLHGDSLGLARLNLNLFQRDRLTVTGHGQVNLAVIAGRPCRSGCRNLRVVGVGKSYVTCIIDINFTRVLCSRTQLTNSGVGRYGALLTSRQSGVERNTLSYRTVSVCTLSGIEEGNALKGVIVTRDSDGSIGICVNSGGNIARTQSQRSRVRL